MQEFEFDYNLTVRKVNYDRYKALKQSFGKHCVVIDRISSDQFLNFRQSVHFACTTADAGVTHANISNQFSPKLPE